MITPVRMRLSRASGWRLQSTSLALNGLPAIHCGRPGRYGNPFRIGAPVDMRLAARWGFDVRCPDLVCSTAAHAVRVFADCVSRSETAQAAIGALRGHNLACWCREREPCHVDVELELANR